MAFEQRWKHRLRRRVAENLPLARVIGVTVTSVAAWFERLSKTLDNLQIRNKPWLIHNCDETGLSGERKNNAILVRKGARNPLALSGGSEREMYMVLFCGNATGSYVPPYILYSGKRLLYSWVKGGLSRTSGTLACIVNMQMSSSLLAAPPLPPSGGMWGIL